LRNLCLTEIAPLQRLLDPPLVGTSRGAKIFRTLRQNFRQSLNLAVCGWSLEMRANPLGQRFFAERPLGELQEGEVFFFLRGVDVGPVGESR